MAGQDNFPRISILGPWTDADDRCLYIWRVLATCAGQVDVAAHGVGDTQASAMQRAEEKLREMGVGALGIVRGVPMNVPLPLRDPQGRLVAIGRRLDAATLVVWSTAEARDSDR